MATIIGTITESNTTPANAAVKFTPQFSMVIVGGRIVTSTPIVLRTDELGRFSTILEVGDYDVTAGDAEFAISVPDSSATFNITTLVMPTTVYIPGSSVGGGSGSNYSGLGSPEGAVVASPGAIYTDLTDPTLPKIWSKTSGTAATGWVQLIS